MNFNQKRKLINCEQEPFGRNKVFDEVKFERDNIIMMSVKYRL